MFRFWSFAQHHFCCLSLFIYFCCYFWDFSPLFAHICLMFIWCLPFWHFWSYIVCTLWCALNTIDGWRWDNELYSFFCIRLSENQRKSIQDRLKYFFLYSSLRRQVFVSYISSNGYWNENLVLNMAKKFQTMRIGLFSTAIHDKKRKSTRIEWPAVTFDEKKEQLICIKLRLYDGQTYDFQYLNSHCRSCFIFGSKSQTIHESEIFKNFWRRHCSVELRCDHWFA